MGSRLRGDDVLGWSPRRKTAPLPARLRCRSARSTLPPRGEGKARARTGTMTHLAFPPCMSVFIMVAVPAQFACQPERSSPHAPQSGQIHRRRHRQGARRQRFSAIAGRAGRARGERQGDDRTVAPQRRWGQTCRQGQVVSRAVCPISA